MQILKTQECDLDTIVLMESQDENAQFVFPNSKQEHAELMGDLDVEHLVLKTSDHEVIGFVILAGIENKNKSIEFRRIVIAPKGQGYGRMAIKHIKKHCFHHLKCHRLWLDVLSTNVRAITLYKSEGFTDEGRLRESIRIDRGFVDLIIMSILANEYDHSLT